MLEDRSCLILIYNVIMLDMIIGAERLILRRQSPRAGV